MINQNPLAEARGILLEPTGITERQLELILAGILSPAIDSADLYFQLSCSESWSLEDSIIKTGHFNTSRGVGIRAISGDKTGFAYSNDLMLPALKQAADAARNIAKLGQSHQAQINLAQISKHSLYSDANPLMSLSEADKLMLLQQMDSHARALSPYITQVNINLSAEHETILVAAHDGTLAADIRPLVRLDVSVIAEHQGRREYGFSGGGGRVGYEYFLTEARGLKYAEEAVRQALLNLEAVPAPAGSLPVVLGPGEPGVLLHEAIGHGLEGDFNRKGSSAFSKRLGERVAAAGCTIVDDGTLPQHRGSMNIDDEGTPTQRTVLIENGVLRNYMQDKLNARLMGMVPTGNGRRESYASLPIPRMTNTYMLPGPYTPEEIIASVDRGVYAQGFSGGQVDITSGKFVFAACEAYMIEKGKITTPIKGMMLIGNGPDVLTRVSMVGNDLQLAKGTGVCGKDGQSVPVGVGQPTLKIDMLTVGGTGG